MTSNALLLVRLVLALVALSFTATAAEIHATVFSVAGTVEGAPPGSSDFSALHKGDRLAVGSRVRTGSDGVAVLVTTPGSAIQVGNDSEIKLNELAFAKAGGAVSQRAAHVQLTSGVVSALIDPRTPRITDFQIQTPEGVAAARGTFYAVLVYNGKTYVGVKEGRVAASSAQ